MRLSTIPLFLGLAGLSASALADLDLMTAYRKALAADATYLGALASAAAEREELPKAKAGLLPSISLTGTTTHNDTRIAARGGATTDSRYRSENYALALRQPLYRKPAWVAYQQAEAIAGHADSVESRERQALATRVAEAYLNVLLAQDSLEFSKSQSTSYASILTLMQNAYKAGAGTVTDVYEVEARLDLSRAQELDAENVVRNANRVMQSLVREEPGRLRPVDPKRLRFEPLTESRQDWVAAALASSAEIAALAREVESAEREVEKAESGHLPTLDLIATHKNANNETESTLNQKVRTDFIGIQFNVPIYAGGYVQATARQARHHLEVARQKYEATRNDVTLRVGQEYANLGQAAAQARAMEKALNSAEQALTATRKGAGAGTRTAVEVLNAQDQVLKTRVALSKARFLYVLSYFKLHSAAGRMNDEVIERANGWLGAN